MSLRSIRATRLDAVLRGDFDLMVAEGV